MSNSPSKTFYVRPNKFVIYNRGGWANVTLCVHVSWDRLSLGQHVISKLNYQNTPERKNKHACVCYLNHFNNNKFEYKIDTDVSEHTTISTNGLQIFQWKKIRKTEHLFIQWFVFSLYLISMSLISMYLNLSIHRSIFLLRYFYSY